LLLLESCLLSGLTGLKELVFTGTNGKANDQVSWLKGFACAFTRVRVKRGTPLSRVSLLTASLRLPVPSSSFDTLSLFPQVIFMYETYLLCENSLASLALLRLE